MPKAGQNPHLGPRPSSQRQLPQSRISLAEKRFFFAYLIKKLGSVLISFRRFSEGWGNGIDKGAWTRIRDLVGGSGVITKATRVTAIGRRVARLLGERNARQRHSWHYHNPIP